ncbi:MAG: ribbon-helix-helix domain-containing protein [Hungatella sp.]|jgi:predicted transcriptional regulator|nr:ribbon-helix-helix domain-containing protein [Hungatella sp.]
MTISFKLNDEAVERFKKMIQKSNMNQSDYIRHSIFNDSVQIIDRSKQFYQSLNSIFDAICILEKNKSVDCSAIRREVLKACRTLNS